MNKNKFIVSLTWELKNLFRPPFPEVMLALFTYMIFLPRGGGFSFTVSPESISWEMITSALASNATHQTMFYSSFAYIPMGIFASILATLTFAYEIENGLLKVHLSHPISRQSIFIAKLLSCFLIVFITFSASLLSYSFLYVPENALYLILSPRLILRVLTMATIESLFVISVTIFFSLYSGKTSVSLIGSFTIIYFIQLLSESANLEFIPPIYFRKLVSLLFSTISFTHYEILNFLSIPLASVFLIILSYLFFSRRLELG